MASCIAFGAVRFLLGVLLLFCGQLYSLLCCEVPFGRFATISLGAHCSSVSMLRVADDFFSLSASLSLIVQFPTLPMTVAASVV